MINYGWWFILILCRSRISSSVSVLIMVDHQCSILWGTSMCWKMTACHCVMSVKKFRKVLFLYEGWCDVQRCGAWLSGSMWTTGTKTLPALRRGSIAQQSHGHGRWAVRVCGLITLCTFCWTRSHPCPNSRTQEGLPVCAHLHPVHPLPLMLNRNLARTCETSKSTAHMAKNKCATFPLWCTAILCPNSLKMHDHTFGLSDWKADSTDIWTWEYKR